MGNIALQYCDFGGVLTVALDLRDKRSLSC
ncbi:hypothetical protein ABIE08_004033 [Kaistia defluvii]|uniref:Uncharacterized protein n=1 Tax=Kaistia defluvii TaxID=410841 RepID=A0ABV2R490_9HYPH